MKPLHKIAPTEQQSLEALEQLRNALTNMGQLRQNLNELRGNGFTLLPQSRRLKIQPLIRETSTNPFHIVPVLQLCGNWLREAGFEHNHYIRIITLDQLLIICPDQTLPRPGKLKNV